MTIITQESLQFKTSGRGMLDITADVEKLVQRSKITTGLCHLFLHHTSASLIISENADPLVQQDLEAFMQRLIPDDETYYQHIAEGPDDMPAHIRTLLTQTFLVIPITASHLGLGTWQGIYLWEHRLKSYHRSLSVTLQG